MLEVRQKRVRTFPEGVPLQGGVRGRCPGAEQSGWRSCLRAVLPQTVCASLRRVLVPPGP